MPDQERIGTFVTVGNGREPFSRLIDAVVAARGELPTPIVVQHGHTPMPEGDFAAHDFMDMSRFHELIAGADVVVTHAGAGSTLTAIRAGKVPVIVPRRAHLAEIADDHQLELAADLEQRHLAIVPERLDDLGGAVRRAVELQTVSPSARPVPRLVAMIREDLERVARQGRL